MSNVKCDWLALVKDGPEREVDALVAERILGLRVEVVKPDWYDREVVLFISPESELIVYSYDSNGCNAIMYRNGVDESWGVAEPLPYFTIEATFKKQGKSSVGMGIGKTIPSALAALNEESV